jgi:hypothetical protein
MARYFFNTYDGNKVTFDDVGQELPSKTAVWEVATRFAGECLCDLNGKLREMREWRLEVHRDDGKPIFRILLQAESVDVQDASAGVNRG